MRIAALYDIHANMPALEAVVDEIRRERVDHLVIGGDVLPGPMPSETLDFLLGIGTPVDFILGNGDREVLAFKAGIDSGAVPAYFREAMRWNAEQLTPAHERLIASWPATLRIHVPEIGDVFFCHATPRNDTEVFTRLTPADRLAPLFDPLAAPLVVCGHTHIQFDRRIGATRVVNAGSLGMPFQEPGAYWLLIGPEVDLRRTLYDLPNAAGRVRATSYPQAEQFASRNVLNPPSEEEMMQIFSRAELK